MEIGSDNRVTYVFSCPGNEERKKRRPAAGQTGHALAIIIALLQGWGATRLPLRDVSTVTNAWTEVEHNLLKDESGTGRTQADEEEEMDEENLRRLGAELRSTKEWILCFGSHAFRVVMAVKQRGHLSKGVRIACTGHPSPRNLSKITHDRYGNTLINGEPGNRFKQVERLAWDLFTAMKRAGWKPGS